MALARKALVGLVAVAAVALTATAAGAQGAAPSPLPDPISRPDNPVPGQYIVTLRTNLDAVPGVADLLSRLHGGQVLQTYRSAMARLQRADDRRAGAGRSPSDPRVEAVEQDGYVTALDTQASNPFPSWGLDRIDQRRLPLDNSTPTSTKGRGRHAPTSSTPESERRTLTSVAALRSVSTPSATARTAKTVTATVRMSPAPSEAVPMASRRTCRSSPCECSTAADRARTRGHRGRRLGHRTRDQTGCRKHEHWWQQVDCT